MASILSRPQCVNEISIEVNSTVKYSNYTQQKLWDVITYTCSIPRSIIENLLENQHLWYSPADGFKKSTVESIKHFRSFAWNISN